ncbi:MAG: hypothetical protein JF567_09280 [Xanthomonadales bacterium]|nr:hypothetical protein [Xanthomonadales bacterium]
MSSTSTQSSLKLAALTLSFIASLIGTGAAQAAGTRLQPRDVSWTYDMQDGSTVRIEVVGTRVLVEGAAAEYWTVANANLLVSPDGLRKIRLLRSFTGTVDRIEMEVPKAR